MNSGTADWISDSKTLARSFGRSAKVATINRSAQTSATAASDRPGNDFGRLDQPALEVVDHVRNLLRRPDTHQNLQAGRRWSAGLGRAGTHLTKKLDSEFTTAPFLPRPQPWHPPEDVGRSPHSRQSWLRSSRAHGTGKLSSPSPFSHITS